MKSGVAIMLKIMSAFALLGALLLASRVDAQDLPNFPDNLGKEFVVVFMENAFFSKTTESLELVLFITNPNDSPVTVNIETPKITSGGKGYFKKSDTVKAGGVLLVELPKDLRIVGSSTKSNKAVVVKATKEIGIYGSNQESYSTGAFVGFPVDVLGKNYYAVTWERAHYKSQIALVATEGGTSVDIVVGPNGKADFGGKTYDAGDKLTVTLAKYESIQIQSTDKEDLTGTSISANKAIAAFSGNQKVNIMNVKGPYDHLVEQLMPVKTWGTTFITLPIPGKSTGDAFRFVASEDSTIITITGMKDEPETIKIDKAGGSKTKLISSEKRTLIKSTKPILVAQFSLSRNAKIFGTDKISSDDGDASMIIIPPVQQLNSDYIFSTLSTKRKGVQTEFTNKFMLAILDEDKNGLLLDGKSLNLLKPTWKKITGTKYMGADFDISPGVHRISHQNPSKTYAGYLYGFTKNEAYSFSTGMRLAQINPCMAKAQVGTNGDGIDNDCDGRIDEEICFEGAESDQDADGKINEDCATVKSDYLRAVSFFKEETVVTSYNAKIFFTPSKKGPLPNYFNVYGYQTSKGASKRQFLKRLVLASANTKVTFTLNGLKGETEYTFTISSRLTGSEVRADNSITVKTTKDPLVAKAATDKTKIEFKLTLENAKLAYTVEWYNEISKTVKKIKTVQLDIGTTTAVLAQSELTLSGYGMIVYAKIYSCKAKPCSTTTVTPFLSNKWRAEVKTTTTKLMLIEGGKEEEIKFTSSAPPSLLCIKDDGPCDSVRVEAYQLGFTSDFKTWNQKPIHQAVISQAGKKKKVPTATLR